MSSFSSCRYAGYISDATVALLLGLVFFIMPAHKPSADKHGIKYGTVPRIALHLGIITEMVAHKKDK